MMERAVVIDGNAVRNVNEAYGAFAPAQTSGVVLKLPLRRRPIPRQAIFCGVFLILLQALDGLFTFVGIKQFGLIIEGNPLLRFFMEQFGQLAALAIVKTVAIALILWLVFLARRMSWLKNAIGVVSVIYLITAVLPWTYILFLRPLVS